MPTVVYSFVKIFPRCKDGSGTYVNGSILGAHSLAAGCLVRLVGIRLVGELLSMLRAHVTHTLKPNVTFREHLRKNAHASSLASSFDLLTSGRSTIFQSSKSRKKRLKKRSLKVTFGFNMANVWCLLNSQVAVSGPPEAPRAGIVVGGCENDDLAYVRLTGGLILYGISYYCVLELWGLRDSM